MHWIALLSGLLPTCQSPVAALSMFHSARTPLSLATCRKTASAIGDRQMLPGKVGLNDRTLVQARPASRQASSYRGRRKAQTWKGPPFVISCFSCSCSCRLPITCCLRFPCTNR
uniref:Putative secreted protein n=1 Tax=Ixodes ricinus TaxID=34613 RepID=A0A6B0UKS4_IXORI